MKNGKTGTTLFYILLISSMILLIISWITPPPWQIHQSVLTGIAEIMGFGSIGLLGDLVWNDKFTKISFKHKDTVIEAEKDSTSKSDNSHNVE